MSKPKVGDERWRTEHISYKTWCDMARLRGWNGEDDADGLRAHCEPEEAATYGFYKSLDEAVTAAKAIFTAAPDDSAFGAVLIEHQVVTKASDDRGNLIRGMPPEWETETIYEVTSDGIVTESRL